MKYKLSLVGKEFSVVLSDMNTVLDFIRHFIMEADLTNVLIEKLEVESPDKTYRKIFKNDLKK